MDNVNTDL